MNETMNVAQLIMLIGLLIIQLTKLVLQWWKEWDIRRAEEARRIRDDEMRERFRRKMNGGSVDDSGVR